jgi:hypothetical protein
MAAIFTLTAEMETREKVIAMSENNGWISVKERMPDIEQNVLVMTECGGLSLANWSPKEGWSSALIVRETGYIDVYFDSFEIETHKDNITHWMPLPKPPQEK